MNDVDKLIRMHQQALIAAQAAKIMQLERENAELQRKLSQFHISTAARKKAVQA